MQAIGHETCSNRKPIYSFESSIFNLDLVGQVGLYMCREDNPNSVFVCTSRDASSFHGSPQSVRFLLLAWLLLRDLTCTCRMAVLVTSGGLAWRRTVRGRRADDASSWRWQPNRTWHFLEPTHL